MVHSDDQLQTVRTDLYEGLSKEVMSPSELGRSAVGRFTVLFGDFLAYAFEQKWVKNLEGPNGKSPLTVRDSYTYVPLFSPLNHSPVAFLSELGASLAHFSHPARYRRAVKFIRIDIGFNNRTLPHYAMDMLYFREDSRHSQPYREVTLHRLEVIFFHCRLPTMKYKTSPPEHSLPNQPPYASRLAPLPTSLFAMEPVYYQRTKGQGVGYSPFFVSAQQTLDHDFVLSAKLSSTLSHPATLI